MALWQLLQSVDSGPISIYAWELCYKYVDSGPAQLRYLIEYDGGWGHSILNYTLALQLCCQQV